MKTGKFWNGYEIEWCAFCKGYNIRCHREDCYGSICALHSCDECRKPLHEFLEKYLEILAETGLDQSSEYLNRNDDDYQAGFWTAYDDLTDYSV